MLLGFVQAAHRPYLLFSSPPAQTDRLEWTSQLLIKFCWVLLGLVQAAPGKDKWDFCRALDFLRPMLGLAGAGLCRIFLFDAHAAGDLTDGESGGQWYARLFSISPISLKE